MRVLTCAGGVLIVTLFVLAAWTQPQMSASEGGVSSGQGSRSSWDADSMKEWLERVERELAEQRDRNERLADLFRKHCERLRDIETPERFREWGREADRFQDQIREYYEDLSARARDAVDADALGFLPHVFEFDREYLDDLRDALRFQREHLPQESEELQEIRRTRPGEFRERLRELVEWYRWAREAREQEPNAFEREMEMRRLSAEMRKLGRMIRETPDAEARRNRESELREILNRLFDLKQEARRERIRELREELEELETGVKRLDENRDQALERAFRGVTGEPHELDWM